MSLLREIASVVGRSLVPQSCAFCRAPVAAGYSCAYCESALRVNDCCCRRCANPLPNQLDTLCAACVLEPPPYARAFAPYRYEFPIDEALKAIKFRRQLFYVPPLAAAMARSIREAGYRYDGVVPVPLHRLRYIRRGFNQARELAAFIARHLQVPLTDCAQRVRATHTQSELLAKAREGNVRGAFRCRKSFTGGRLLIVDDVMTTGHTGAELARTLHAAGCDNVHIAVVARAGISQRQPRHTARTYNSAQCQ